MLCAHFRARKKTQVRYHAARAEGSRGGQGRTEQLRGAAQVAVEVARAVVRRCPDGVWLVELAPVSDPGLVPHSVAVPRVHENTGQSALAALAARLRARRALLLLDNCEHLLNAC